MRTTILIGLLLFATSIAAQETDKPAPATEHHFRYEIGIEKTRTVTGWFEETDGKVRTVSLDLDGDGRFEKRKLKVAELPPEADAPEFIEMSFSVSHEGAAWGLQYFDLYTFLPEAQRDPTSRFNLTWTVSKGQDAIIFSGANATFHPTAEAAAKADAVRIGGGITLDVTAGTQGPKGLVNLTVKDASGCSLSQVMRGGKLFPPTFALSQGEEVKLSKPAPFG